MSESKVYAMTPDHAKSKPNKKSVLQMLKQGEESRKKNDIIQNRVVFSKLFHCLYFICKKKWAHFNYEDFVRFVGGPGISEPSLKQHLQLAPDFATYLSTKTGTNMLNVIGEALEEDSLHSLRNAPFFSLLADESTDESNITQFAVFCRWFHEGNFQDRFIGLIEAERTDSKSLMEYLRVFLVGKQINIEKCRFVGFDGTNAMSGHLRGLQRRFRHYSPHSLYINCRNHRLALCLKHLMKTFPQLVQADETLLSVWKLFHYSPQRFAIFNEVQTVYGQETLTLVRAATSRWLSHWKAAIRLFDRYEAILDALDAIYNRRKEPEVYGVRHSLCTKPLIAMLCILSDVLKPVHQLSLYLQGSDVILTDVEAKVKKTLDEMDMIREVYETCIGENQLPNNYYASKMDSLFDIITERTELARRIRGDRDQCTIAAVLRDTALPFIDGLKAEIIDAFHLHPVFQAFRMAFDPSLMPLDGNHTALDLQTHGQAALLTGHYGVPKEDTFQGDVSRCTADINGAELVAEYAGFKTHIMITHRAAGVQQPDPSQVKSLSLFLELDRDPILRQTFPTIWKLLYLINIIPASTASVERCFSVMNLLKTPLRNLLRNKSFDSLMRISIDGPAELSHALVGRLINKYRDLGGHYILL